MEIKVLEFIEKDWIFERSSSYSGYRNINEWSKHYTRRHFKEFYYLNIEPSNILVIWTYIISLLLTIGMCVLVVKNEIN